MKKLLSYFLIFSILLATGVTTFAKESVLRTDINSSAVNGDTGEISKNAIPISNMNQARDCVMNNDSLTNQEKNNIIQKLNDIESLSMLSSGINGNLRDTVRPSGTIVVPVITQENGHYCGPATVKQTLSYINGSAGVASQDQIATDIGTTSAGSNLKDMVDYVNLQKDYGSDYLIVSNPGKARIQGIVEYGVLNKLPTMCRLKFSIGGSWIYKTNGHFMNANGYTNYGTEICVTDPNIKRENPNAPGSYWVKIDELYNATHDHPAREIAC